MDNFFEKIIIGHNSFFGIDHLSAERGRSREQYFTDPKYIISVINLSCEYGAKGMMMSTHERAKPLCESIAADSKLKDLKIYPLLPYVQKYVVAANEKGLVNVLFDTISSSSGKEKLEILWSGAKGVLTKDLRSVISSLIQMELAPFKKLNVPCVFLHDAFTDLGLALNLKGIFEFYHEEMEKYYKCKAAFATKNPVNLVKKFKEWGFPKPLVMAHVNKIGFNMNPSKEACEEVFSTSDLSVMVMSSLASGHLKPEQAYEYLGNYKSVESIVVSASSKLHIEETYSAIKKYIK